MKKSWVSPLIEWFRERATMRLGVVIENYTNASEVSYVAPSVLGYAKSHGMNTAGLQAYANSQNSPFEIVPVAKAAEYAEDFSGISMVYLESEFKRICTNPQQVSKGVFVDIFNSTIVNEFEISETTYLEKIIKKKDSLASSLKTVRLSTFSFTLTG